MTFDPRHPYNESNSQRPENQLGERIAPGFWIDKNGNPHISLIELMDAFELEDTPQNREQVQMMIQEMLAEHQPNAKVMHRETPDEKL